MFRLTFSSLFCLLIVIISHLPGQAHASKNELPVPIQLRVNPTAVNQGGNFTYHVTVPNPKKFAFTGMMVVLSTPDGVTCQSVVSGQGCTVESPKKVSCMFDRLEGRETYTAAFACQVAANACGSTKSGTKNIATSIGLWARKPIKEDSHGSANLTVNCAGVPTPSPTATVRVTPTVRPTPPSVTECSDYIDNDSDGKTDYPADEGCSSSTDDSEDSRVLTVSKVVSPSVQAGGVAKYTFTVSNRGTQPIHDVKLEDFNVNNQTLLPIDQIFQYDYATHAGCSYAQGSRIVLCELGVIWPGQTLTFDIYFRVPAGNALCGLDVMNQVDVNDGAGNSDYFDWAKAVTRVVCSNPGGSCNTGWDQRYANGYGLLNCANNPQDVVEQQCYNLRTHYAMYTPNGNFHSTWGADRGYNGFFWYQSNSGWMYLDPKTGNVRIWNGTNTGRPGDDIFVTQLGGSDACGVCLGCATSCQPRQ